MYADDADLFYSQNDTRELFRAVNAELKNLISGFMPANYCWILIKLNIFASECKK